MTDKPIIFSAPMIRALLGGRKTQTRRPLKNVPPPPTSAPGAPYLDSYCSRSFTPQNPRGMSDEWCWWTADNRAGAAFTVRFVPGDRLWVRETFQTAMSDNGPCWLYRSDQSRVYPEFDGPDEGNGPSFNYEKYPGDYSHWAGDVEARGPWRSPIHMPRWASRLTLTVTAVRVERLNDISEADAIAEGIEFREGCWATWNADGTMRCGGADNAREAYRCLWINLHGPGSWALNPFVAVIEFTVDAALATAGDAS